MFTMKRRSVVNWLIAFVLFLLMGMGQTVVAQANEKSDVESFQEFLRQERKAYNEDFEIVDVPVYELLEWDIEDTSTWDGITIVDERITEIDFPLASLGGTLDLINWKC